MWWMHKDVKKVMSEAEKQKIESHVKTLSPFKDIKKLLHIGKAVSDMN